MSVVQQAVWFVENHLSADLALDDIAGATGVSRFHLTRAFGSVTGQSLMQYVRARRLSEAARRLAAGAPDILTLALDAGYGSHEAFTRSFRDHFGVTPEALRGAGDLAAIAVTHPIKLDEGLLGDLADPRMVERESFLLAGLSARYSYETSAAIPAQWQRFAEEFAPFVGRRAVDKATYGVLFNSDDAGNMDYLSGMEVRDFGNLTPPGCDRLRIPRQRYAVFEHAGHVSAIRRTWHTIWNRWLPASGYEATGGPEFERYGEGFDPHAGIGDIEIWIPVGDGHRPCSGQLSDGNPR